MNKRRLLKLAGLLEADAKNKNGIKFDLYAWAKATNEEGELDAYAFRRGQKVEVSCGTAACAWGLAAISGAFKRSGLGYKINADGMLIPTFGRREDFKAAEAFFEIDQDEAAFLFDPSAYPHDKRRGAGGERFVAKRIRDLVAGSISAPPPLD